MMCFCYQTLRKRKVPPQKYRQTQWQMHVFTTSVKAITFLTDEKDYITFFLLYFSTFFTNIASRLHKGTKERLKKTYPILPCSLRIILLKGRKSFHKYFTGILQKYINNIQNSYGNTQERMSLVKNTDKILCKPNKHILYIVLGILRPSESFMVVNKNALSPPLK